jgi:hypothetical protein
MKEFATLLFVGDISLGGDYAATRRRGSADWAEAFAEVRDVFQGADLKIGNLEDPLFRGPAPRQKKNLLGASPESVAALTYLGFTALSLGNNHITDQGAEGIARTREILTANAISPFGAGENLETARRPAFARVNGLSFAFLAYATPDQDVGAEAATDSKEGCAPPSLEEIERDIIAARRTAQHVVVSLHWGYQYDRYPDPKQITMAHRIIDLGARIVHGHHPHVLQGIERYKRGLILYSLGNFFFPRFVRTDGVRFLFPAASSRTAAVVCDVGSSGVESFTVVPLAVDGDHRMHVLKGRAAARAARSLVSISTGLGAADYAPRWQSHHAGTVRRRNRQDERLEIRREARQMWLGVRRGGIASAPDGGNLHRLAKILRLLGHYVRSCST